MRADSGYVPLADLRRRILLWATLGAFAIGLLSAAVASVPLVRQLEEFAQANMLQVAHIHADAIQEYRWRTREVSLQIASRSRARELMAHLEGTAADPARVARQLEPLLAEALTTSTEAQGITRLDMNRRVVAAVGTPVPEPFRRVCRERVCDFGLHRIDGRYRLVVGARVRLPAGEQVATDIILYSVEQLDRLLHDRSGLGRTGVSWLVLPESPGSAGPCLYGSLGPEAPHCERLPEDDPLSRAVRETPPAVWRRLGMETRPPYILAHAPIGDSGWAYLMRIERREVLSEVNRRIAASVAMVFALTGAGAAGLFLVVRPLAGGIAVRAATLNEAVQARTAELHTANVELGRANRELGRAKAQLEALATTDSLTGVPNRRHLETEVERLLPQLRRHRHPVTVLVFDLDEFKRINDSFGHGTGDEVLRGFAATVAAHLRAEDLLARFGGEEFVAVLPETGQEEGLHVAERIRSAFGRREFGTGTRVFHATVSIGVCTEDLARAPFWALLKQADQALYRAKQAGRNRVVAA